MSTPEVPASARDVSSGATSSGESRTDNGPNAHATPAGTPSPDAARPGASDAILQMEQAIALLRTTRPTFYRWLRAGRIKGMKVGRQWRFMREDIERFLRGQGPRVDLPVDIGPLVRELSQNIAELGGRDTTSPQAGNLERAVHLMILLGLSVRASHLHIEPFGDALAILRYRVDGVLHTFSEIDGRLLRPLVEEWKRQASADTQETRRPQDGRILYRTEGSLLDLRVCFTPTVLGEMVAARLLTQGGGELMTLDQLDYAPDDRERLWRALGQPQGMVIVTGPAGSGRSTTLYACLLHLRDPLRKIVTVEDPVECLVAGTCQIQVDSRTPLTFAETVRSALRCDPDVVLVGEIRDLATLQACVQAALTGRLVLTTLATESAAAAPQRLIDMGLEPWLIRDAVRLLAAQRLVRRLCPHCRQMGPLPVELRRQGETLVRAGGLGWEHLPERFGRAVGCPRCAKSGYRGRTVLAETIEMTAALSAAVLRGASALEVTSIALGQGTTRMAGDGMRRAAEGHTSVEEVLRVLGRE